MGKQATAAAMTTLSQQHANIQAQYPDVVLCYRIGDSCLFLEDGANAAQRVLGIQPSYTDKLGAGLVKVSGVKFADAEATIAKLIAAGYKVGMVEQMHGGGKAEGDRIAAFVADILANGEAEGGSSRMCSCGRAAAVAYLTAYGSVCRECWCEALRGPAEFARYRASLAAQSEPQADESEADRIAALVADIAASGEVEADLFGEIQRQEEQQHWEGPSVEAQIADVERRIEECETLIACESGSCRTHAIESRYYLNERLRALVAAIEARDLPALTAIVAAGNRERAAVAA